MPEGIESQRLGAKSFRLEATEVAPMGRGRPRGDDSGPRSPLYKAIGLKIAWIRANTRWTDGSRSQVELAKAAGTHFTTISDIEGGIRDFKFSVLLRITEALGVTVADIFSLPGSPLSSPPPAESGQDVVQATIDALVATSPAREEIEAIIARVRRTAIHTQAEALKMIEEAKQIEAEAERREAKGPKAVNGDSGPDHSA